MKYRTLSHDIKNFEKYVTELDQDRFDRTVSVRYFILFNIAVSALEESLYL